MIPYPVQRAVSQNMSVVMSHITLFGKFIYIQGGPIKTVHFWRYHIFAATTDIIMRFLLKCSEITGENNKQQFKINF